MRDHDNISSARYNRNNETSHRHILKAYVVLSVSEVDF